MATPSRTLKVQLVSDVGEIKKDVASVTKSFDKMRSDIAKKGGLKGALLQGFGMGAGFGAFDAVTKGIGMVTDFLGNATKAASDQAEAQSKVTVVFGKQAQAIKSWATDSVNSMGMSETAALDAAGTFGNLFDSLGLTDEATRDMSKGIIQLASDLGSFNNVGTEETLLALRSGLLGEAEPMRRFGSALTAARVEAYILAKGIAKSKGEISEAMKVQARYALILEDTTNAQGDFARTSEGMANKQKKQAAAQENLNVKIGKLIAGPADLFLEFMSGVVDFAGQAVTEVGKLAGTLHDIQRVIDPGAAQLEEWVKQLKMVPGAANASEDAIERFARDQIKLGHSIEAAKFAMGDALWLNPSTELEQSRRAVGRLVDVWKNFEVVLPATQQAMDQMKRSQDGFLATLSATDKQALMEMANLPGDLRAALVAGGAPQVFDPLINSALGAIAGIVRLYPTLKNTGYHVGESMADGVRSSKDIVRAAAIRLNHAIKNPFEEDEYKKYLIGRRMSKKIADGLRSKDKEARIQARGYINVINRELVKAQAGAYNAGAGFAASFIDGMFDSGLGAVGGVLGGVERRRGRPKGFNGWSEKHKKRWLKEHPGRASGGPVGAHRSYLVGERGPELLTMGGQSGNIIPNHHLGGSGNGGGGMGGAPVINIYGPIDAVSTGREIDKVLRQYYRRSGQVTAR